MRLKLNYKNRIKAYALSVMFTLLTLFPQLISGQEYDIESEMEKGVTYFQNAQFTEAFLHFERISKVLSQSGDDEVLPVIYYLCQACKSCSGDLPGSIPYGEKANRYRSLSPEYKVQVLSSLLRAYDELKFNDKCIDIIIQLKLLWSSYKVTDIIESLISYYSNHQEYAQVIRFENDVQSFENLETPDDIDKTSNMVQLNTIYLCMAKAFSETSNFDKSISYLEKCLDTLTPYTQENKSSIYLIMAATYNKMGNKKSALKYQKLSIDTE